MHLEDMIHSQKYIYYPSVVLTMQTSISCIIGAKFGLHSNVFSMLTHVTSIMKPIRKTLSSSFHSKSTSNTNITDLFRCYISRKCNTINGYNVWINCWKWHILTFDTLTRTSPKWTSYIIQRHVIYIIHVYACVRPLIRPFKLVVFSAVNQLFGYL